MGFFASITWRMARSVALWVAGALVSSGVLVYAGTARAVHLSVWRELQSQVDAVRLRLWQVSPEAGTLAAPGLLPAGFAFWYQVTDLHGALLNGRPTRALLPWRPTAPRQIGFVEAGEMALAYVSEPVALPGRARVMVQVATDWEPFERTLHNLRRVLESVGILATVIAMAAGIFSARSALRPIEAINRAVRNIGPRDLNTRLPLSGPPDELYRLKQNFNDMLSRIGEANRRQTQFVADASHELRTPVAIIEGYATLLLRWGKDDPQVLQESLEAIARESRSLKRLVADLLTAARMESGRPLAVERVDLSALVREAVVEGSVLAPQLQFAQTADEGVVVQGDPGRLRQVLFILLDNAIRYTPPGRRVTVSLRRTGAGAEIVVADEGVGIAAADLPYVFERFYRADRARARPGGLGLGLAIARDIVAAHGGDIDVASEPGQGTTVRISLPCQMRQRECTWSGAQALV